MAISEIIAQLKELRDVFGNFQVSIEESEKVFFIIKNSTTAKGDEQHGG